MGTVHNAPSSQDRRALTDIETARLLRISVATVRRWRLVGEGPRYRKFGGSVRYFLDDIEAFIAGAPSGGGRPQGEVA